MNKSVSQESKNDGLMLFQNKDLGLQLRTILNEDGSISVNAEDTAVGFGWVQTQNKSGKEYMSVRWETLNRYCKEFSFPNMLGKDDYLPESLYYLLAMKANNEKAQKFQRWLALDVIPTIRKTGSYKAESNVVTELDRFIHCAEIMANCLEDNRPYVLNILRNVVPNISEVSTSTVDTVEVPNVSKTVKYPKHKSRCGYATPFNHKKFDEFLFDNCINTHWLETEIGCSDGCVSKWRYVRVRPTDNYCIRMCEVLGVSIGYFNNRTRRTK